MKLTRNEKKLVTWYRKMRSASGHNDTTDRDGMLMAYTSTHLLGEGHVRTRGAWTVFMDEMHPVPTGVVNEGLMLIVGKAIEVMGADKSVSLEVKQERTTSMVEH